jgi:hypothetical protein
MVWVCSSPLADTCMCVKFQSRFVSGMWAIGSVSGPIIGGAFAEKGNASGIPC